jgi:molybdenum cofactor cytidylyltransferase
VKPAVAAIVLAAGRSRRMGEFKPLLPFGNETVIETCIGNLRAGGANEIVVVVGHRAEDVRRQLKSDVAFATNPNPDSAMSDSIKLGLQHLSATTGAVMITPVDHSAVSAEVIQTIIQAWRDGAKLIQPEHDGRGGHPVLIDLVYRYELINLDEQNGLRGFFERHRADALRLPIDSPFVARDMDTWDDYVRLHQDFFGRKPEETAKSRK